MARCGCASTCSCLIEAGDGVQVDGIGSVENPYVISSDAAELLDRIVFDDSSSVDFSTTGTGTELTPMHVTATATLAMSDLTDVQSGAANGQVLVWVDDHWEPQDQSGGSGGSGIPPGGTDGQVLTKQSDIDGDALWENPTGTVGEPVSAASRGTAAGQSIPNNAVTKVALEVLNRADNMTWDGVNNQWVIAVIGWYRVVGMFQFVAHATGYRAAYIYVNGSPVASMSDVPNANTAGQSVVAVKDVYLTTGDTVDVRVIQTSGASLALSAAATYNYATITKVPSSIPQSVALGERNYSISYRQAAAVSCPTGIATPVPWDTLDHTEGGITKDSAGIFTVPVAGYYQVNAKVAWDANGSGYRRIRIGLNGSSAVMGYGFAVPTVNGTPTSQVSRTIKCAAGDTIQVSADQNSGVTLGTVASTPNNSIDITKVPAPTVAGSAASGLWGVTPLDIYGGDSLVGREVYVDSNGQLRGRPNAFANTGPVMLPTTLPAAYPNGLSSMYLSPTETTGSTWPVPGSFATVLTQRPPGGTNATQIWTHLTTGSGGSGTNIQARSGNASGWGAWIPIGGGDTGWVDLTPASGAFTHTSGLTCQYRVWGQMTYLRGTVTKSSNYATGDVPFNLPAAALPSRRALFPVTCNVFAAMRADITAAGAVTISVPAGVSATQLCLDGIVYEKIQT